MHEIQPQRLWLGHAGDVRSPRALFDQGIAAVVDVAMEEPPAVLPRQLIYCRFPLHDGGGNGEQLLQQSVQTLIDFLSSATPLLVACSAGMSRSPTIAAFALAVHHDKSPTAIVAQIAKIKTLEINPCLWHDVERVFPRLRRAV